MEVMCHAMNLTSMERLGKIEYELSLEPLHRFPNALMQTACLGAVVNIQNKHWVALKRSSEHYWLLDSQEPLPIRLSDSEYKALISRHHSAFPIYHAGEAPIRHSRNVRRKISKNEPDSQSTAVPETCQTTETSLDQSYRCTE